MRNAAAPWRDKQGMSDAEAPRRRDHLRLVNTPVPMGAPDPGALDPTTPRPRTLGRLIAQTAELAEHAVARRQEVPSAKQGIGERWLRRLRPS